jgi:hypothetical protein
MGVNFSRTINSYTQKTFPKKDIIETTFPVTMFPQVTWVSPKVRHELMEVKSWPSEMSARIDKPFRALRARGWGDNA